MSSPARARAQLLKSKYNLTPDEFAAMWNAQDKKCAICSRDILTTPEAHVDHNHATNKVRAILCVNCNMGLGQFRDDPTNLRLAAEYLDKHNG